MALIAIQLFLQQFFTIIALKVSAIHQFSSNKTGFSDSEGRKGTFMIQSYINFLTLGTWIYKISVMNFKNMFWILMGSNKHKIWKSYLESRWMNELRNQKLSQFETFIQKN